MLIPRMTSLRCPIVFSLVVVRGPRFPGDPWPMLGEHLLLPCLIVRVLRHGVATRVSALVDGNHPVPEECQRELEVPVVLAPVLVGGTLRGKAVSFRFDRRFHLRVDGERLFA